MTDKGHCSLGDRAFDDVSKFYDFSIEVIEKARKQSDSNSLVGGKILKIKKDESSEIIEIRVPQLLSNGELELPNGKIVGTKQYTNYYKQNLVSVAKKQEARESAVSLREANGSSLVIHDQEFSDIQSKRNALSQKQTIDKAIRRELNAERKEWIKYFFLLTNRQGIKQSKHVPKPTNAC